MDPARVQWIEKLDVTSLKSVYPGRLYAGMDALSILSVWIRFPGLCRQNWKEKWWIAFRVPPPPALYWLWDATAHSTDLDDKAENMVHAIKLGQASH